MFRWITKAVLAGCVLLAILSLGVRIRYLDAGRFVPISRWIAGKGHEFSAQINGDQLTLHHIYPAKLGTFARTSLAELSLERQIIEILGVDSNGWKRYRPAQNLLFGASSGTRAAVTANWRGMTRVRVPLAYFPIAFCIPPIVAYLIHRVRQRYRQTGEHECRGCGYNLTGNVSGRCPECGQPVEQITSAT